MLEPDNKLFNQSDGLTASVQEQQRLKAIAELGLLEAETIPVFEEATQTAAHFLEVPICILGFVDQSCIRVRSAVGLSRLGLMNPIARERQMPRHDSLSTHVIEKQQVLAISDTSSDSEIAQSSVLVEQYGIRAYLGAPLFDAVGHCLGVITVMNLSPRTFTARDIQFLELMARWSMSEFERNQLLKERESKRLVGTDYPSQSSRRLKASPEIAPATQERKLNSSEHSDSGTDLLAINQVKLEILTQLTHDLRTPLTTILGMANVVGREIYGPLTSKQKEYLEIIQTSGKHLLSLVNEISELGSLDTSLSVLNPAAVEIEMLCQQAINSLEEAVNRREQEIRLLVEAGRSRIWFLDRDKVKQLLYHLVFSVIHSSPHHSVIRIHVSYKSAKLNLAVSVSHPWLGDGLIEVDPKQSQLQASANSIYPETVSYSSYPQYSEPSASPVADVQSLRVGLSSSGTLPGFTVDTAEPPNLRSCESLHLLLSYYMAQLHGGQISIQGTPESGYRYIVSLPELEVKDEA
ncbi:MAG: GAF domain-containing sensor histidine kinase [Chroococcidiopsidaceae cyanobacterium CP_BM_ER_R8_30]|nr:GAF domain-containing sensor histidine kinase [Chroococcidiopsidaceae cyanobacterium CP_BM_ER_R8_30]